MVSVAPLIILFKKAHNLGVVALPLVRQPL